MELLLSLLAAIPAIGITFGIARWCAGRQRTYFEAVVATRGGPARHTPPFKIGLGLDELSVGTWDYFPALGALRAREVDPDLDDLRRSARVATVAFLAQLPAGLVEVVAAAFVLRVMPIAPALVAFLAWGALQSVAFRYALAFGRPEIEELRAGWGRGLSLVGVVVVALLVLYFGLVALALFVRG